MPHNHAKLSPSASHRWLHCTPSVLLEASFESKASPAAEEGTDAHALCEHKLKRSLHMRSKRPVSAYDNDEMEECSDAYVAFVLEQLETARRNCNDPLVLIEQRVSFSEYVPDGFGMADCLIVADKQLHVIDFKYGIGVFVEAENNSQLMCYALGALSLFDALYDVKTVSMSIVQPRRENICTWSISVEELKQWGNDVLRPRAAMALKGEGEYCPGEWCTFCRAAVKCRARSEENLRLAREEFKLPPLLADGEIEEVLHILPKMIKWATELMAYATDAAVNHGKIWNGFKIVEGRSCRRYTDDEKVAKTAEAAGYKDIYRRSLIPLTEMERLMGRKNFEAILGGLVVKPPGKPVLVPNEDKRPAINVTNEFNAIGGN